MSSRTSRKPEKLEKMEKEPKTEAELLKEKLKQKLAQKKMGRTARDIRENKLEDLKHRLKKCRDKAEREKLKAEIGLIEDIEDKEADYNDDHPQYD